MKKALVILSALACGCYPCRQLQTATTDSIQTTTHTEVVERIVHDTVRVELPAERIEVSTPDTVSVLRTSFAESRAEILGGLLHHTLQQRGTIAAPVALTVADTTTTTATIHTASEVVTVEVAAPLTWWQETQIKGFWLLFVALALWIAYKIARRRLPLP